MSDLGASLRAYGEEADAFESAIAEGDADAVTALLNAREELLRFEVAYFPGMSALHFAAYRGQPASLRALLNRCSDADAAAMLTARDESHINEGKTPLLHAASAGCIDCVRMLLDRGAAVRSVRVMHLVSRATVPAFTRRHATLLACHF